MEQLETVFKDFLRKKGLKFTPERKAVLAGLCGMRGHFDADLLYDTIRTRAAKLSRATVYRSLPLFVRSGILHESVRTESRTTYELVYGKEHHDHLICIRCGRIIEFKEDGIEHLKKSVCLRYGFTPVEHRLGIRGFCKDCRKK